MTHLYIELNTGLTEEVNSSIISKLYELAISGDLDETSDLKGRLHTEVSYRAEKEYLTANYPNLYISSDEYAIEFEDPNMLSYLNSIGIGSNGIITESQAAAATYVASSGDTTVRKFNELKYFTGITGSRGGLNSTASGWVRFTYWTALEEIDISNFTSLGHNNTFAWEDTFNGCSALKKVTASDKLKDIGYNAFNNCPNLEEIIGLLGTVTVYGTAFNLCLKLKNSVFENVEIQFPNTPVGGLQFSGTKLITTLTLSQSCTNIPDRCFEDSNITTINIPSGVLSIGLRAFYRCSNLRSITLPTGLQTLGAAAFYESGLESLTIPNTVTTLSDYSMCRGCRSLITVNLPSSIDTLTNEAFRDCTNLETINIDSIVEFRPTCLSNCQKTVIQQLSSSTTKIGDSSFYNCQMLNIEHLNLPLLTEIGSGAFAVCHIDHIDNLGAITSLGTAGVAHGPFDRCDVKTAVIPSTVNYIARRTFYNCNNLQWIKMLPTTPPDYYANDIFEGCNNTFIIYVPDTSLSSYQNDIYWGQFNLAALSTFPTS